MRKTYMKPAAHCMGFAINENIANSLPRTHWEGIPNGATVDAELKDGVVQAVITLPDGNKVYGTSLTQLANGVREFAGDDFELFFNIMNGYGLQVSWFGL